MVKKLYSIFDEKGKYYSEPFQMLHDGEALRAFGDLVADPKTTIARHPVDYTLWKLGEFDNCSGLYCTSKPEYLAKATDFVKVANEKE